LISRILGNKVCSYHPAVSILSPARNAGEIK